MSAAGPQRLTRLRINAAALLSIASNVPLITGGLASGRWKSEWAADIRIWVACCIQLSQVLTHTILQEEECNISQAISDTFMVFHV